MDKNLLSNYKVLFGRHEALGDCILYSRVYPSHQSIPFRMCLFTNIKYKYGVESAVYMST